MRNLTESQDPATDDGDYDGTLHIVGIPSVGHRAGMKDVHVTCKTPEKLIAAVREFERQGIILQRVVGISEEVLEQLLARK